jgi:hypothetical protein
MNALFYGWWLKPERFSRGYRSSYILEALCQLLIDTSAQESPGMRIAHLVRPFARYALPAQATTFDWST